MTQFIYESPKKGHLRSTPVDEYDKLRRHILEEAGWMIVERIDDDGSTSDVITVDDESANDLRVLTLGNLLGDRLAARKLVEAGYPTAAAINEATDEELEAIDGIGPTTVLNIRNAVAFGSGEDAEGGAEDDAEPEVEEPSEFEGLDEQIALKLIDAGYDTLAALNEATDEELEAIDGIGPATVLKIRQALAFAFESDEEAEDEGEA